MDGGGLVEPGYPDSIGVARQEALAFTAYSGVCLFLEYGARRSYYEQMTLLYAGSSAASSPSSAEFSVRPMFSVQKNSVPIQHVWIAYFVHRFRPLPC